VSASPWPVLLCSFLQQPRGYDGIVYFALLRNYKQKVTEFQAKEPLLQVAFPLDLSPTVTANGYQIEWAIPITNYHEAEIMLKGLGCDDRSIQRAMARFLSASTPKYDNRTLEFEIGTPDGKDGNCLPQDIFDRVAAEPAAAPNGGWRLAPTPRKSIEFEFQIKDSDAAKRFFAPLPDWYAEAIQRKIEVASVPEWMKPGEPPPSRSFAAWLDRRSPWLILAAGMLALSVLCFVVASRIGSQSAGAQT
jgi:hypothetical protein